MHIRAWVFRMLPAMVVAIAVAADAQAQAPAAAPNSCVKCHEEVGGEAAAPISLVQNDVHGRRGFSCVSCHGGDPTNDDIDLAKDPRKGFVGRPSARQVQGLCGKCHSSAEVMRRFNPSTRVDQEAEYATSVHGKKVAQGDRKPATCISCHGNHGIKPVKDSTSPVYPTNVAATCSRCHADAEYMKPYGIPVDQGSKYSGSVHAEALIKNNDLSAPTCNDCHGNHGAAPPGVSSVANVCGTCHTRQSELFDQSPHKSAFDALGASECVVCHSNHEVLRPTDESLGTGSASTCVKCHDRGEPGYAAAEAMHRQLRELSDRIDAAEAILGRAARAGMEVSRPRFELTGARDGLVNGRVVIHGFNPDELAKGIAPNLEVAERARRAGEDALEELQYRRKGLAVALVVIAAAVMAIYLKIRQIEAR